MSTLKAGQYRYERVPAFDKSAIPALLQHRSDAQVIKNYPKVSESSYPKPPRELGFIILWTIEGILQDKNPASHRPVLYEKLDDGAEAIVSDLGTVAALYSEWVEENLENLSGSPLDGTPFFWR